MCAAETSIFRLSLFKHASPTSYLSWHPAALAEHIIDK
jgi:hypothetical protein